MAYSSYAQTRTGYDLLTIPSKELLREAFVGKSLDTLHTPCMIIDRSVFAKNCAEMQNRAQNCGMDFRAHIKSHKVRCLTLTTDSYFYKPIDKRRSKVTTGVRFEENTCRGCVNYDGGVEDH
jgi:hypothetical protein